MRLLWYSNHPMAPTGYGGQTKLMLRRLRDAGHEVACAVNYGLLGHSEVWEGIPLRPQGKEQSSLDMLLGHYDWWSRGQPTQIITLYDVWPFYPHRGAFTQARIASWTPVDHQPVPPAVVAWGREHYTIAMSEFGRAEFGKAGIQAKYAPHGVDRSIFKPTSSDFRPSAKLPEDAFIVTINAANKGGYPPRKSWSEMFQAFARFAERHRDAFLYVHSDIEGMAGAPNLRRLADSAGIPENRLRWVDQYHYLAFDIPDQFVAAIYTGSDVLLATSMGEGFGIPVIEAQACGTPVIVTDFSAQPELVGAGWKVAYQRWPDHLQDMAHFALPLVDSIVDALEAAYAARGDQALRQRAVDFTEPYDADHVFETYWQPILADLEARLSPVRKKQKQGRRGKAA